MATVGYAYLKIMPSLQGLGRHVRDQVRETERGAPSIALTAQVQTTLLREQLRAAAREGDQTAIRLLAELDAIPAETKFAALRRRLDAQSVSLKVVLDKSVGSTVRGLGEVNSGVNTLTRDLATHSGAVGAATLKYGAMAGGLGSAVGGVGALGAAVQTASGSLLVLPAVGVGAAAAMQTLKVAVAGFSDAVGEQDPKKYAEAIKEFPPAMTEAANAARALRPELVGLRQDVQQQFFAGLALQISVLARTYMPVLHRGLGGISDGLNQGARGFTEFAREGRTVSDVGLILGNTSQATHELARAVKPVFEAFRDVAAVGSGFLPSWATSLGDSAQRLAAFIARARESGQLAGWMSSGLSALGDLFLIVRNLAQTIGAVFKVANTEGGGFLGTMLDLSRQVRDFVRSAEGINALKQIFGGLHAITVGLNPVLQALGQALVTSIAPAVAQLGPMIGQAFAMLAPAIAPLGQLLGALAPVLGVAAQALAAVLVPAIAALAPIVTALAPPLSQVAALLGNALGQAITTLGPPLLALTQAITPLIPVLGGLLVQAIQTAAPALAELLTALTPIVAQLGGAFLDALGAVLPVIGQLAQVFTAVFLAALQALMPVLPVIVDVIRQLAAVVGQALTAAAPVLTQIATLLGQILAQAITTLLPIVPPLATAFLAVVTALLPLLPPILQLVSQLLPPLMGLVTALMPIITGAAQTFAMLMQAVAPLIEQLGGVLIPVIQSLFAVVKPIFDGISGIISGAMRYIGGVIDVVLGLLTGNWDRAWNGLKNMLGGIWDIIKSAVKHGLDFLLNLFIDLPGSILSALGDLGSLLLDAGGKIIDGLVEGITSGFKWVKNKLGELTDWITSWKGPPARDKVLLTANGRLIMRGLLTGLEDGEPQIRDYLTGLTDALPLDVNGKVTGSLSTVANGGGPTAAMAANRSASAAPASGVTVVIDANGLPRALAEWFRHAVRVQGGGSVQAAFGQ